MKIGDVDFCVLCLYRQTCQKHKEEPEYKGTMCLAWAGDKAEKARRMAEGRRPFYG